jgi:protein associated with RNAse G/E
MRHRLTDPLTLEVSRSDGSFKWRQPLHIIERIGTMIVGEWRVGDEVVESDHVLTQPATTRYVVWTDRWYDVIHNSVPMYGRIWYCNIATPAVLDGGVIRHTDLDLDVAVTTAGEIQVLDEDEFVANQARHGHAESTTRAARAALVELLDSIARREFPFDHPDLTSPYRPVGTRDLGELTVPRVS